MNNFIPLDGDTSTGRYIVVVDYLPTHNGQIWRDAPQFCHLPWRGNVDATPAELIQSAQAFFDAKYGPGSDLVTEAKIYDRGEKRA